MVSNMSLKTPVRCQGRGAYDIFVGRGTQLSAAGSSLAGLRIDGPFQRRRQIGGAEVQMQEAAMRRSLRGIGGMDGERLHGEDIAGGGEACRCRLAGAQIGDVRGKPT